MKFKLRNYGEDQWDVVDSNDIPVIIDQGYQICSNICDRLNAGSSGTDETDEVADNIKRRYSKDG